MQKGQSCSIKTRPCVLSSRLPWAQGQYLETLLAVLLWNHLVPPCTSTHRVPRGPSQAPYAVRSLSSLGGQPPGAGIAIYVRKKEALAQGPIASELELHFPSRSLSQLCVVPPASQPPQAALRAQLLQGSSEKLKGLGPQLLGAARPAKQRGSNEGHTVEGWMTSCSP